MVITPVALFVCTEGKRSLACKSPGSPADSAAKCICCEVDSQGVGCHGSNEHGRGDGTRLEAGQHDIGSNLLLCALGWVATAGKTECLGQGEENAACPGSYLQGS